MPLYRLKSAVIDLDPVPAFLAAFVTPLSGPFVIGQRVASPRQPDVPMIVVQVGPVDFGGETGYLCEVSPAGQTAQADRRWFSEPDLVASP